MQIAKSSVSLIEENNALVQYRDIKGLLARTNPRLIDEWQEIPEIWDAVRNAVDRAGKNGQFILTGSAAPKPDAVKHSGAVRIARVRMGTMSLFESGDSSGGARPCDVLAGTFEHGEAKDPGIAAIAAIILRGGWPQVVSGRTKAEKGARQYLEAIYDQIKSLCPGRSWR